MLRRKNDGFEDDSLRFADEPQPADAAGNPAEPPWKILVVDDEQDVHVVTRLVLRHFTFGGRGVELLNAYSAGEAEAILARTRDVAVILLDVVMESDDAGLQLVRRIRQEMGNRNVRIILRTGQPGQAPEQRVVAEYDINDYKSKMELTTDKLCTSVTSALRSWRDICDLERSRSGLRRIIDVNGALLEPRTRDEFAGRVLEELVALLLLNPYPQAHGCIPTGALVARRRGGHYATGDGWGMFAGCPGASVDEIVDGRLRNLVSQVQVTGETAFDGDAFCAACPAGDEELLLLLTTSAPLRRFERDLLRLFAANTALSYRNLSLNREIIGSQNEMIVTLSEVVETRSRETANHVRRVGEMAATLARLAGAGDETIRIMRVAAPLHDVGKVGIPDAILHKPGRLSGAEFEIMKTHTAIGHAILGNSTRRTMRMAAEIALQHHERWDGAGYPLGRAGEAIPFPGRVTALVDVFDALVNPRVYRAAWPLADVLEHLRLERGRQFDPRLVDLFLANVDDFVGCVRAYPDRRGAVQRDGANGEQASLAAN